MDVFTSANHFLAFLVHLKIIWIVWIVWILLAVLGCFKTSRGIPRGIQEVCYYCGNNLPKTKIYPYQEDWEQQDSSWRKEIFFRIRLSKEGKQYFCKNILCGLVRKFQRISNSFVKKKLIRVLLIALEFFISFEH